MTATYSSTETIPAASEWPAYLLQGEHLTATVFKIRAFLYAFKAKFANPPPGPEGSKDPPQSGEPEDYWSDPMLWTLMFH